MSKENLIQVERAAGYSREQAYVVTFSHGAFGDRAQELETYQILYKKWVRTLIVESQIDNVIQDLKATIEEIKKKYPKRKPVEYGTLTTSETDDDLMKYIIFGKGEHQITFKAVNAPLYCSWQALV